LLAEGEKQIHEGRFFTIFAPRQSGKTTYSQMLLAQLSIEQYTPLWISFENFKSLSKSRFYEAVTQALHHALADHGLSNLPRIHSAVSMGEFFAKLQKKIAPVVLVIDEFENIPPDMLSEVMGLFHELYHQQRFYALQALILVGVNTIAKTVLSTTTPFNIADELQLPYFSLAEVENLIDQYMAESGQVFEPAVIKAIYENTQGQPGLVCALSHYLVNEIVIDRTKLVTVADFYKTLHYFPIHQFDTNIANTAQEQTFMLNLLLNDKPVELSVDLPDIAWLYANSVIDEAEEYSDIAMLLYTKRLFHTLDSQISKETNQYSANIQNIASDYLYEDNTLNLNALLNKYRTYIHRRGFQTFNIEILPESAWYYSLHGFISFFIEQINGKITTELPTKHRQIDILIQHQAKSYIIKTQHYTNQFSFKQDQEQLVTYLNQEGLTEGYFVVFSDTHTPRDTLFIKEIIQDICIYTHIVLIKFNQSIHHSISK